MVPSHLEVHTVIAGLAELHYQYKALAEKIVVEKLFSEHVQNNPAPPALCIRSPKQELFANLWATKFS